MHACGWDVCPIVLICRQLQKNVNESKTVMSNRNTTMKTTIKDDRTEEQKHTHYWAVVANDRAMSNWGLAEGGTSRVAWACESHKDASKVLDWVKSRREMKYVSIVDLRTYRNPATDAHFHVYVVDQYHPAFLQDNE
jgi:hypothetical protein